jgi:hypothetical protein
MPGSVETAGMGTIAWRTDGGLLLGLALSLTLLGPLAGSAEVATDGTLGAKVRLTGKLSSRCVYLKVCTTCRLEFIGSPHARYCSDECRRPAKIAAAARQRARWAEMLKRDHARARCAACSKPISDRQRLRMDPFEPNYCSNACRQKAYRRKRDGASGSSASV